MNEKPSWLKRMFLWEQKTLQVNGRSMAYLDEGDAAARPVLLLHGNPTLGFPLPAFCRTTGRRWLPRDRSGLDLSFPRLVPIRPDHPGAFENRIAIERLRQLELPVLLPWGDADPILGKLEPDLRAIFRNVAPPLVVRGAGHFIQEDAGEEVAGHIRIWLGTGR